MKRLILWGVLAFALLSFGFCAQEEYVRPWEDNGWVATNEHIMDLGLWEVWYVLEPTANISRMDALGLMMPFHESLEESEVEELHSECETPSCSSKGSLGTAVRYKQWAEEAKGYTEMGVSAPVMGAVPGAMVSYESIYAWNLYSYVGNWKGAMGNMLDAVGEEGAQVNANQLVLKELMGKLENTGICSPGYAGPGAGICFETFDDVACNSSGLWDSVPDMGWYPDCMRMHWEASASLQAKYLNASTQWNSAMDQLEVLAVETGVRESEARDWVEELKLQRLDRIYLSAETTDISGVVSIRDDYYGIMRDYSEASNLMAGGGDSGTRTYGWYKNRYDALLEAAGLFESVAESSEALMLNAEEVVGEAEGEAKFELAAVSGEGQVTERGQTFLQMAAAACAYGDAESLLGTKFEKYMECRMYAGMAGAGMDIGAQAEYAATLAEAEDAVASAERDGLDVFMEKALLQVVKERKPANSVSILRGITDGLVEKAELAYAELPGERGELWAQIAAGGSGLAFLGTWMEGEECYVGDELDYACALGMLKTIEESYEEIGNEITLRAAEVVGNSLIVEYYETCTAASLHENSFYGLVVKARNPLDLGAENVLFEVPAGAEIGKIDAVDGEEQIRLLVYEDGAATVQLYNISPHETMLLEFSKEYAPCAISGIETISIGDGVGGARTTETVDLRCSIDVDALYVGENIERAFLDGKSYKIKDGMLRASIAKGKHELVLEYKTENAYRLVKNTEVISTVGTKTTVSYMIDIIPSIDLDSVPVWVDEREKAPERIEAMSYTGERISNKQDSGDGLLYFEIRSLEEGVPAKVRIRYEFSNISGYIMDRITEANEVDLSGDAQIYFENATESYSIGDYAGALAALEEMETQVEKEAKERAKIISKHEKLYDEILKKAEELGGAVSAAENLGLKNSYVSEMCARAGYLEEMLLEELAPAATVSPLEDVDMGWEGKELTKIQKYLKDGETKLKKEWMATGVDDANLSRAIEVLEEGNAFFSGTMRFEDGISAMDALAKAQVALDAVKVGKMARVEEDQELLSRMIDEAEELADDYEEERNSLPRGHRLVSTFQKSPSWVKERLESLSRSDDVEDAISEVSDLKAEMGSVLGFLKRESERMLDDVEGIYESSWGGIGEKEQNEIWGIIQTGKDYYQKKEYAKAIVAAESALEMIGENEGDGGGLLVLGVTALLVIGVVAFLLLGKSGLGGLGKKKGGVKRLKKIEKDLEFD